MEVGPDWETLVARQIREAMARGQSDNLPFQREPLPNDDNPYAGDANLAYHVLKNAGVAPPWIASDKEVRELLAKRDAILEHAASGEAPSGLTRSRDRAALEELVTRTNAAIARVNLEAPTDRQHRRPIAVANVLARYDEACCR